jgi:hypothetical protein
MADRKPADPGTEARLAAIEAENTMIARAICHLAVAMPGGPEPRIERILTAQLHMPPDVAGAIIAAAKRPG